MTKSENQNGMMMLPLYYLGFDAFMHSLPFVSGDTTRHSWIHGGINPAFNTAVPTPPPTKRILTLSFLRSALRAWPLNEKFRRSNSLSHPFHLSRTRRSKPYNTDYSRWLALLRLEILWGYFAASFRLFQLKIIFHRTLPLLWYQYYSHITSPLGQYLYPTSSLVHELVEE
jgi:hypothetical protein